MADANFDEVKIVKADGSIGAENKATGSLTGLQASYYFGANNDLWSEVWTPANINDIDFGVVVSFQGSTGVDNYKTHYLKATNFGFTIPGGATIDGIYVEINGKRGAAGLDIFADIYYIKITVYYTEVPVGTNMKINISDVFKDIESLKINIGNAWKNVIKVQQNIGDVWKNVFG